MYVVLFREEYKVLIFECFVFFNVEGLSIVWYEVMGLVVWVGVNVVIVIVEEVILISCNII